MDSHGSGVESQDIRLANGQSSPEPQGRKTIEGSAKEKEPAAIAGEARGYVQTALFDLLGSDPTQKGALWSVPAPDKFWLDAPRGLVVRETVTRNGDSVRSTSPLSEEAREMEASAAFDASWLRSLIPPPVPDDHRGTVRTVDLFSGCGALTLGVAEACRALGLRTESLLAMDVDETALETYSRNFPEAATSRTPIEDLLNGRPGASPSAKERALTEELGDVDLLLGGPPCQGNSDLNNHTRRDDPKNALFLKMARFAELTRPRNVIIENVPGVVRDKSGVVASTRALLEDLGYRVDGMVLRAADLGVPQTRRRYFMVASLEHVPSLSTVVAKHSTDARSIAWACSDLLGQEPESTFDSSAVHHSRNRERIDYLFDHDLHDLPNDQRPDCHKTKAHSYNAVYGRMHWELPAPTITSGFGSTGQGRFVHPRSRRTLTPHEAARLQFIPDFFDFGDTRRVALQEMIGNAVPPKLGYAIGLELLR